ncbi:ATP-binding protein [Streptomyces sp. NPDC058274]|uniref:ATP-binding protein n=1 Tax=Streptomyces sp. NPDC058274 TaxID=3346416 RepID=UPI0036E757AE
MPITKTTAPARPRTGRQTAADLSFLTRAMKAPALLDSAERLDERASVIVTSNKPFGRWGEVFGDETVAAAMIDRLVHHAEVHSLKGDSYRMRGRQLGRVPPPHTTPTEHRQPDPVGQNSTAHTGSGLNRRRHRDRSPRSVPEPRSDSACR